ncbi:XRE family transcriptional regulator [Vibrio albus]|uniref:XRE family transcriptional regulator n=1 Tax=Vibrio albus TaxID=2200953 RepID=A0A2U3B7H4_9VIBR|nr:XRE family transcriptional regulator [Vibrio albus]PWI32665.1 XRE family transcriptional regulator [Vibrio albus]
MTEQQFKQGIAAHLKEIRKQRQLSLDAVARLTGVSKAMLGQIEREESSPTIAKLWQIASGLETSFSAFFTQTPEPDTQQYFPDPDMTVKSIFPYSPTVNYEIHEITLTNHHCQMSDAHALGVIESIIVLEGEMDVLNNGCWERVKQGGNLRFYADQPHGYKAVTETVVFQNIVSY